MLRNKNSKLNGWVRTELSRIREAISGKKFESEQNKDEATKDELGQLTIKLRNRMMRDDRIASIESSGDVSTV
jgi:hypothetical protein